MAIMTRRAGALVLLGMLSIGFGGRVDANEAPGSSGPAVALSVKNDVSPPLHSVRPIVPAMPATIREIPLRPRPRKEVSAAPTEESVFPDPVIQTAVGALAMPSPLVTFEGIGNVNGVLPPDTNGDVGPNHYVQIVNLSFAIFSKSGTLLYGPASNNTLWLGFGGPCESTNDGDPIVLYDHLADRWLLSQFALPNDLSGPFYQCIAISQTGDPMGAWNRYAFLYSTNKMNDYPKLAVWPDGYYMTANQYSTTDAWAGAGVVAFERAKMLTGLPAQMVQFDLFGVNQNFGGMLPADLDGPPPPAGSAAYFAEVDDTSFGFPTDSLRIWRFHVDWIIPANSTFGLTSQPNAVLDTAPFDPNLCNFSRNCIPQPGTIRRLDALSDRLMYRLQYRNFGTHESLAVNHTVDVGGDHAGIRWYEVRDPGGTPFIHQQGTYAPDASHRWMGSVAMDGAGNMAMGFSVSATSLYPSIRYVGRLAGDPLGTMPQGEAVLISGNGSQTHSASRWGDYSMMAVDPTDDCTFWYTQEYYSTTSSAGWKTRIGSFKFPTCGGATGADLSLTKTDSPDPVPVGGTLTYAVTVTNYGPTDATGVGLIDTLPLHVNFVSATSPCTHNSGTVTCNLGVLANGTTVPLTIVVTPLAAETLTNSATVTANEPDLNPANNVATALTTVTTTTSCRRKGRFTLSGNAKTASGAGISGVTMSLTGPGGCRDTLTTNTLGRYVFSYLANGTYTVTPDKSGCSFVPSSRTVTISNRNAQARFTGSCGTSPGSRGGG